MNFCSLTTKERLSTAPPATNIPSIHAISENVRNWDGKCAAVKKLVQNLFAAGKEIDACRAPLRSAADAIAMIANSLSERWRRYGRPMQAWRPFGNITLLGQGL